MQCRTTALAGFAALALLAGACGDSTPATTPDVPTIPDTGSESDATTPPDTGDDVFVPPDTGADTTAPDGGDSGQVDSGSPDAGDDGSDDGSDTPPPPSTNCRADQCEIDGECWDNGEANPDNPCEACFVIVAIDVFSANDEGVCDDGDACTDGDFCEDGVCVGGPSPCDDANPCTVSICDSEAGTCFNENIDGPCDDGDPCTIGDLCAAGVCQPGTESRSCDDGNPCTSNACESGIGCVATPLDGIACDDGDTCTVGDSCEAGVCVPGADPLDCDDNNLCTVDRCDPLEGCIHRDISSACGDDNPCTDAACDPLQGCIYPFNTNPCDDGNLCTEGDTCTEGVCRGTPVFIDGGNECIDNTCDPLFGIISTPNTEPCDDANACTLGDVCADGGCQPGTTLLVCDDANVCTDDFCDAETGCVFVPNDDSCDDGSLCTINTSCVGGECVGTAVDCDDGNACTVNSCSPSLGCRADLVITDACRPEIVVTWPPRGAFVTADGSGVVTVTGTVQSGAGVITSFSINDQLVSLAPDGSFAAPFPATFGGNILTFRAEDELGSTRERVQSYVYSDIWTREQEGVPSSRFTPEALGVVLGQPVFDQLTAVLSGFLTTLDLGELLGGGDALNPGQSRTFLASETPLNSNRTVTAPSNERLTFLIAAREASTDIVVFLREVGTTASGTFEPTQPAITFGDPTVNLTVEDDAIAIAIRIPNIAIRLRIYSWGLSAFLIPSTTTATSTALTATTRVRVSVVDGEVVTTVDPVEANLAGFTTSSVTLNLVLAFVDLGLDRTIAEALDDALPELLGGVFDSLVGALQLDLPLELPAFDPDAEPITVNLRTELEDFRLRGPGTNEFGQPVDGSATVILKAEAAGDTVSSFYADAPGSANRSRCMVGGSQALTLRRTAELEVGLNDNTINALLHAVWGTGLLEQPLPASLFEGVDLASFGVSRLELTLAGMLPPVASDCRSVGGAITVHIGDLRIDATVELLGTEVELEIYVSAEATIRVEAGPGGIGIFLDAVDRVELEVNAVDETQRGFEGVIGDLLTEQIEELLPSLFGGDGDDGALFTFELPEIDLSGLADGLEGGVLRIETLGSERLDGTSLIRGRLEAVVD